MVVETARAGGVTHEVALVRARNQPPDVALLGHQELEGLGARGPALVLALARVARGAAARVGAVDVGAQLLAKSPLQALVAVCKGRKKRSSVTSPTSVSRTRYMLIVGAPIYLPMQLLESLARTRPSGQ